MSIERYPLSILFFFIAIAFFLPLGFTPLFDLDEGAFSEATREMLVGHDYITTYLNGELRFDKPILIYWFQLLSVKLFGLNEFGLRLPSAVAGTLWAMSIYFFVKRTVDQQSAFFATLFMIVSLQITLIAKAAIADSLLNLFIVLSMFSIFLYFKERKEAFIYWTFLFIALGTLTKGPVAIMIPFVVTLLFFWFKGELMLWFKILFNPKGILIFLIVASPWYIAEYLAQGQAFIDGFIFKHNLGRFSSAMESHKGNFFYFVPVLLLGLMPFTSIAIKAIGGAKTYLKSDLKSYLFIWFAFVFLFFSFSGTKLPHYVVYGYTPLFILSASYMSQPISKRWLLYPLITLLSILLFLADIATFFKDHIRDALAVVLIENAYDTFDTTYQLSLIVILLFLFFLLFKTLKKEFILLGVALAMVVSINFAVIPAYGKLMQQPIKEAGLLAKEKGYKPIIMYNVNTPSFNVYYQGLVSKDTPKHGDIVFTKVTKLKDFPDHETLYEKNGFTLIKVGIK